MGQCDKLLVINQIQMTQEQDMFHGQSLKLRGVQLSTGTLEKRATSQEEECLCIGSMFIMSDTTMFLELQYFVVNLLQPCVGSVSTFKST